MVEDILLGLPSVRRKTIVFSFETSGRPLFISSVFAIVNAAAVSVFQCGQLMPSTASIKDAPSVLIGCTSSASHENKMTPALAPASPKLIRLNILNANWRSFSKPGPYQFTEPDPSNNNSMSNCAVQTRSCGHSMVLQYAASIRTPARSP